MANVLINENSLRDIGDAIRAKRQTADTYYPSEMGEAIRAISVIEVDPTLTQDGQAADAKVTGMRLGEVEETARQNRARSMNAEQLAESNEVRLDNIVDETLTERGKAADAGIVGGRLAQAFQALGDLTDRLDALRLYVDGDGYVCQY